MLTIWIIILIPWFLFAIMLTGMSFEGEHTAWKDTLDGYLSIAMAWSYPVLVAIAFLARRKWPALVWLPLLTGLLWVIEDVAWRMQSN
jgi:hypothetical protein